MPLGEVRFEREDETVVAVITGEVDMSNAATIRLADRRGRHAGR